ncbi:MAG: polysaccharide biosynthesis protein [Bacteroidales bacterium]|nr:polysaccharide biosynthesis protein [Bacteroidales bacterium]
MQFFKKIFSSKVLPSWTILLFDLMIATIAVIIGYLLRFDTAYISNNGDQILATVLIVLTSDVVFFKAFHTYSNVLRLSSFVDLMNVFAAISLSFITCIIIDLICTYGIGFDIVPVVVLIISAIVSFMFMVTMRLLIKYFYDELNADHKSALNVFIYGTTDGGIDIAKSIRTGQDRKFNLCGFIADDPAMKNKVMMGVNVYMNDDTLLDTLIEKQIGGVIVSPVKMQHVNDNNFADNLLSSGIQLLMAPYITDKWQGGNESIKSIQIEDLLMRAPIDIDMRTIASHLEGAKVMITGAAGSIGSEIMRQVASFNPYQLILIDQAETPLHDIRLELLKEWRDIEAPTIIADISNERRMEEIFAAYKPDYVFHAAAYKHVPMMEDNVSEAIQNNILGTRIVADLSLKYGVRKFVMISTDKAVNPSNVMGCSKRICEIYVQSLSRKLKKEGRDDATQFITTRFGNVLGSNGSVIPLFRRQIENGGPVTVTHPDIIRYFMTIPEACKLVLEAGSMGNGGEIYIFDMGEPVRIVDLAKKMISLSGRTDIKIEFTGLRHGEKLYEELLNTKENTEATKHDKIMIAKVREYDFDEVAASIKKLIDASYDFDQMATVSLMKSIVPEFKSLNSAYSTLDKTDKQ